MPIALVDATHLVGDIVKALSNVQKITSAILLLPLQGVSLRRPLPRAMPWAMCLLPLRGALHTIIAEVIFLHITMSEISPVLVRQKNK